MLNELEALAEAALVLDHNEQDGWYSVEVIEEQGAYYPKNARFISACDPQTILRLIELVREMNVLIHDAIETGDDDPLRKALAKYKEIEQ